MSGKKLFNSVDLTVMESLQGLVTSNPDLAILQGHQVVLRRDLAELKGKVAILSGGGSGHEPAHAGFVGRGMLTGVVAGAVFTSPPVSSILAAIKAVARSAKPSGILLVVKNYTGDRINFGLALERAMADDEVECDIKMVVVGDDCALTSQDKSAGRRGLAATVFVHKIAGALADKGRKSLSEIVSFLKEHILEHMGTIGLSLSPCSLPGSGPSFHLAPDEMELGLGIHGEAGVKRLKLLNAEATVRAMLDHMTSPDSATRFHLGRGEVLAVMVNNLGGTSGLEMGILTKEIFVQAHERGWVLKRAFVGAFMTSLEMAGFSISLMRCSREDVLDCLDHPVSAIGWPRSPNSSSNELICHTLPFQQPKEVSVSNASRSSDLTPFGQAIADSAISFTCEALMSSETQLNQMDTGCGDGDCGTTLKRGAEKLLERWQKKALTNVGEIFNDISFVAEEHMGGSAGAMYSILFAKASTAIRGRSSSADEIFKALHEGAAAMMKYGGAEPGDRTMLDALCPALAIFDREQQKPLAGLEAAVTAAEKGAEATANMKARAGRASYVAKEELKHADPGAQAVATIFRSVYQAVLAQCHKANYLE